MDFFVWDCPLTTSNDRPYSIMRTRFPTRIATSLFASATGLRLGSRLAVAIVMECGPYLTTTTNSVDILLLQGSVWRCEIFSLSFVRPLPMHEMQKWRSMIPASVNMTVCQCVRLSVTRLHCAMNGWTDPGPVWVKDSWRPKAHCIRQGSWSLSADRMGEGFDAAFAKLLWPRVFSATVPLFIFKLSEISGDQRG